jgi:hypothetical protein
MIKKRPVGVNALGVGAVALVLGAVSFAVMPSALAATSAGPDRTAAAAKATAQPPGPVVIRDAKAPRAYRFAVAVPDGGRLRPVESTGIRDRNKLTREIVVEDASGSQVGGFDQASALDAAGKLVPTSYRIEGTTLVQTVEFGRSTAFPVVIEPTYNAVGSTGAAAPTFGAMAVGVVTVPSNYVYNPSLGWPHDYCTSAPDEFYTPWGPNADFRGPCARHDMCYEAGSNRYGCDDRLWSDMVANCEYAYPPDWKLRTQCKNTAWIYWGAVTAYGH